MSNDMDNNSQATNVKTKKKIVFAKDRKQAILAIVVMLVFFSNSVYMIVKYLMEQKIS